MSNEARTRFDQPAQPVPAPLMHSGTARYLSRPVPMGFTQAFAAWLGIIRDALLIVVLGLMLFFGATLVNAIGDRQADVIPDPVTTECIGEEPC